VRKHVQCVCMQPPGRVCASERSKMLTRVHSTCDETPRCESVLRTWRKATQSDVPRVALVVGGWLWRFSHARCKADENEILSSRVCCRHARRHRPLKARVHRENASTVERIQKLHCVWRTSSSHDMNTCRQGGHGKPAARARTCHWWPVCAHHCANDRVSVASHAHCSAAGSGHYDVGTCALRSDGETSARRTCADQEALKACTWVCLCGRTAAPSCVTHNCSDSR
jgi:hypothetical protein